MKIVVIIPSRYQSTRFEGKALALISGKPMVQWVYERSVQADRVDDVAVATDDQRIADAVETFGGKAIMTSNDNRSGTDRVGEAAAIMGLTPDDIIINVQGDQPLLDPRSLDQVVSPFFDEPGIEMSTLGFPIVNEREITDPKDIKVVFDQNGFALYFFLNSFNIHGQVNFGRIIGGDHHPYRMTVLDRPKLFQFFNLFQFTYR